MSRTVSENFGKHSRKVSMLINTTRQEERIIEKVMERAAARVAGVSDIDCIVKIIERLDASITEKDAMIKRLQQGHKVL